MSALPIGYYQLTLLAVVLQSAAEIHLRASASLPSISLVELIVVPALAAVIVELQVRPRLRARAAALVRENRWIAWYGGYAAIAAIAGLVRTPDTLQTFHDLFVALALYALIGLTIDEPARLRGLLIAALAGASINVGFAALQFAVGGPYPVTLSENVEAKLDLGGELAATLPTGLFNHPNGVAMFLLPVVIFLGVCTWRGFAARPRRELAIAALLVPVLFVLQKTYAKGVYAWLAVGVVFVVLPRRFDRHRVWLALASVVAGITALTWLSLDAFLRGDLVFGTIISRIELWIATWNILRTDGFVAVFGSGGEQLLRQPLMTFEYSNAHNAWLDQALTYGLPALVLYLGAYVTALRSLARRIRTEPHPSRTIALATFGALVGVLGESFFEPTNHNLTLQTQLFLLLAIVAALRTVFPASRDPRQDPRPDPRYAGSRPAAPPLTSTDS
jgi:hypothetical protein